MVLTGDLDFDRLRNAGQIADQVFHELKQFDFQGGHASRDAIADVVHHRFNVATGERFQTNEKIALVRFCQPAAELETGAAGIGFNFRGGAENQFDLAEQSIGFFQRCSGGASIV